MSNILSQEAQRKIGKMYRARFIVAGSYVAIVAAVLAAVALFPMYITLRLTQPSKELPPNKVSGIQDERAVVRQTLSLISTLSPLVSATTTPSMLIEGAISLRPDGVTVDRVLYSSGVKGEIVLEGSAKTRDGINAYRQALESDINFETVTVPVSNLVGAQGGRFSITITGSF